MKLEVWMQEKAFSKDVKETLIGPRVDPPLTLTNNNKNNDDNYPAVG